MNFNGGRVRGREGGREGITRKKPACDIERFRTHRSRVKSSAAKFTVHRAADCRSSSAAAYRVFSCSLFFVVVGCEKYVFHGSIKRKG